MQIYIVRTEVDYEVPVVMGYYSTQEAASARTAQLAIEAWAEGDDYPLDVDTLVIEEVTLDADMTPVWL
jgi:hypothetical protein